MPQRTTAASRRAGRAGGGSNGHRNGQQARAQGGRLTVPRLASLDPRAARWIGALIRMSGSHPAMTRILDVIERLQDRPLRTNFVLLGEPGTGKEGLARALHQLMSLSGPIERLDVTGFSDEEGLAALCGRGKTAGVAERAHGGTILIEEAAALGPRAQLALLRLLKAGRCTRVGGAEVSKRLDVVAIALSDRDLPAEVEAGRFRHDLYYRLARLVLWLPPLRERVEDIGPSAIWMGNRVLRQAGIDLELRTTADLARATADERARAIELTQAAIDALAMHAWRGNFRELETVIERALLLYRSGARLGAGEIALALARPDGRND